MKPADPTNGPERPEDELAPLERAWRELPDEEPPELLDLAVLNRARRAVEGRRAWPWTLGWYHGLGTAAGVLLVVTVFLQMQPDALKTPAPMSTQAPAEQRKASATEALGAATGQLRDEAGPEPAATEVEGDVSTYRIDNAAAGAAANEPMARPAVDAAMKQAVQPHRELSGNDADRAGTIASDAEPGTDFGLEEDETGRREAARTRLQAEQVEAQVKGQDELDETLDAVAEDEFFSDDSRQREAERRSHEMPGDGRASEATKPAVSGDRIDAEWEDMAQEAPKPEAWLEQLQALRDAGEEDAFKAGLEAFIAAYPDHPLPEGWAN